MVVGYSLSALSYFVLFFFFSPVLLFSRIKIETGLADRNAGLVLDCCR